MIASARSAAQNHTFACSDSGIPTYHLEVGTELALSGPVVSALREGSADVVAEADPPLLPHVTDPLTGVRSHAGKDVPIVSVELVDGSDVLEMTCSPKALGSGRWAFLEVLTFPTIREIEEAVVRSVLAAGSQPCPPIVVGVGVGGSFDHAAGMAKHAMLRPVGEHHAEPAVAAMEERLTRAVNELGFGPMGTGGIPAPSRSTSSTRPVTGSCPSRSASTAG